MNGNPVLNISQLYNQFLKGWHKVFIYANRIYYLYSYNLRSYYYLYYYYGLLF
jgi:hypothetical protein